MTKMENSYDENSSAKKKLRKEQAAHKEEVYHSKKKQKKLKELFESSDEKEAAVLAKKKPRVFDSVEESSPKKQTKRHRESSLEGKLAVSNDEEKEQTQNNDDNNTNNIRKKKKKKKKETSVNDEKMEDPHSHNGAHDVKPVDVSFRLLVPSKEMGKVIGKQGYRIQQLREETGAHIKIGDAILNLEERVIWIASKEDTLTSQSAAERALLSVATLLIRPENEDQEFAKIRLLVAGSQAKIAASEIMDKISEGTGAVVNVFSKDRFPLLAVADETDRLVQVEGKTSEVQQALELVLRSLREGLQQPRTGGMGMFRGKRKGGALKTTVQIEVPKDYSGKLIGKGGSTLRQIQKQCRVSFEVHDDVQHDGQMKIALLKGTLAQVTMAQTLLQVFLASKSRVAK